MHSSSYVATPIDGVSHARSHQEANYSLSSSLSCDRIVGGCNDEARPTKITSLKLKERTPHRQSSSFKGICWNKVRQTWLVRVLYKGERVYVGNFRDEIEAAKAYDKKAIELLGSGAILNFPGSIDSFDSPAPVYDQESDSCNMMKNKEISKGISMNKKNKRKRSMDEQDNKSSANNSQPILASPACNNNIMSKEYEKIFDNEKNESDKNHVSIGISPPQKKISKYFNGMVSDANHNTHIYYPGYIPSPATFNPSLVNERWTVNNNGINKLLMTGNPIKESEPSKNVIPLNHCNTIANGAMYLDSVKSVPVEKMIGNVQFPHDINPLLMLSLVAHMTSNPSSN